MITDPIKLTPTLATLKPTAGGAFAEQTFRLKAIDLSTGSVRIGESVAPWSWELSLRQQESNENKAAGIGTTRTQVRLGFVKDESASGGLRTVGSISVVMSLPKGGFVEADVVAGAIAQLAQLLLTESDDPTADTAINVSTARLSRILAGEP